MRLAKRLAVPVLRLFVRATTLAVRWSGLPLLARHTWAREKVGILVYHNPAPEVLERHLQYLRGRYSFIALDDLVRAMHAKDWRAIPSRSLVLTIDDGHRGNLALVDILRRHGIQPTMYICTQIVGTHRRYWWTLPGIDRRLLRSVPNEERLRILEDRHGFSQTAEVDQDPQALTVEDVAGIDGAVDFQAHTRFHPFLPRCDDEECYTEIAGSKTETEALSGKPARHFSYPNGEYGPREIAYVKQAGFASARTVETGWNDLNTDPYRLKIIGMPDNAPLDLVASQLTGLPLVRDLMFYAF